MKCDQLLHTESFCCSSADGYNLYLNSSRQIDFCFCYVFSSGRKIDYFISALVVMAAASPIWAYSDEIFYDE